VISAFDDPLLPQLLPNRRPLILAFEEFFPVLFGLFSRDELVKRGDVEDDAVVEVGL
jgi:hypothetical protein